MFKLVVSGVRILRNIFIIVAIAIPLGCSSAKSGAVKGSYSGSSFQTSYINLEKIVKVSSLKLSSPIWEKEALNCKGRLDVDTELRQSFVGKVNAKIISDDAFSPSDSGMALLTLRMVSCQERVGSAYGVTTPAHVGFLIGVVDSAGKEIWAGAYSLKDTAILENILLAQEKLKIGPGWLSATQLLRHGLELAAQEFENQRSKLFLGSN